MQLNNIKNIQESKVENFEELDLDFLSTDNTDVKIISFKEDLDEENIYWEIKSFLRTYRNTLFYKVSIDLSNHKFYFYYLGELEISNEKELDFYTDLFDDILEKYSKRDNSTNILDIFKNTDEINKKFNRLEIDLIEKFNNKSKKISDLELSFFYYNPIKKEVCFTFKENSVFSKTKESEFLHYFLNIDTKEIRPNFLYKRELAPLMFEITEEIFKFFEFTPENGSKYFLNLTLYNNFRLVILNRFFGEDIIRKNILKCVYDSETKKPSIIKFNGRADYLSVDTGEVFLDSTDYFLWKAIYNLGGVEKFLSSIYIDNSILPEEYIVKTKKNFFKEVFSNICSKNKGAGK